MATIRFTDEDRDADGFVKVAPRYPEPRSLVDLGLAPVPVDRPTADRRPMTRSEIVSLVVVAIAAVIVLIWSGARSGDAPAVAPRVPAAAAAPTGDAVLTPSPLPATAPVIAGRLLIAFAAPDGQPLGAIESTRAMTMTAHYGAAWIQADVAGSGLVWLRASDSPELAIVGPDLAPKPTPRPPPATATPEPPPCASAGVPGKMVEVCDYADLGVLQDRAKQQWIQQYGGNVGIVTTPTPYGGH